MADSPDQTKPAKPRKRKSRATGKPVGRPRIEFNAETKRRMKYLGLRGFTEAEISDILAINQATFSNWKVRDPQFFETLNDWKDAADYEIERSLYERAKGYEHKEAFLKWHGVDKGWLECEVTKRYPPDPTSMIFWLKNRKRAQWRDRKEIQVEGDLSDLTEDELRAAMTETVAEGDTDG